VGRASVETTAKQAVEVISLDVYRLVEATGAPLTERLVRDRLAELASHPPGCRHCGGICEAAAKAGTFRVMHQVRQWRESIALNNIRGATHSRF
jgi:hypothetical protein